MSKKPKVNFPTVTCENCPNGIAMCRNVPCAPLPQQVIWYMDKQPEVAKRFRLEGFEGVAIVAMPDVEHEDRTARAPEKYRCSFLSGDDKCLLHGPRKPFGGATACCKDTHEQRERGASFMFDQWNTDKGRAVVAQWKLFAGRSEGANDHE